MYLVKLISLIIYITISTHINIDKQINNFMEDNNFLNIPIPQAKKDLKADDPYGWMRAANWPKSVDQNIIDHLNHENKYYNDFISQYSEDTETLFRELKSRIKLTDQSAYIKKDEYYYYTRTEEDKNYSIYCRRKISKDSPEEILLDVNKLAQGQKFVAIGSFSVSPDHNLIAYSVDYSGNEEYQIFVYDIIKQEYCLDSINNIIGPIIWLEDNKGFFYTAVSENWRHNKVYLHMLNSIEDRLIFQEDDKLYFVNISKSSSKEYLFINVRGHDNNELYFVSMKDNNFNPEIIRKREKNILYSIDHDGKDFYLLTNINQDKSVNKNFHIFKIDPSKSLSIDNWELYITEDNNRYLAYFDITKNYILLSYKSKGLPELEVISTKSQDKKFINFPDPAYTANIYSTNFQEDDIRIDYSSLARPSTIFSYNFSNEQLDIIKRQEIPSGLNSDDYKVERLFAKSNFEGKEVLVPITLLYKKSLFKQDGSMPLYLYGYGSYGHSVPVSFRNMAISIANRGMVFAIAHIRGGSDLGHSWYEDAKFLNKKRSFADFIACTEFLIEQKYVDKDMIVIAGGSAGGMLIGNVINDRPDLYKIAVAHVPFVDVLNTMLDETLPLTPQEFKEWGNPKEPEYFEYIKSYSPYDNIKHQKYPHLFVTAGLNDPRVGYWEAAKWVAKIREVSADLPISEMPLILYKTNMEFGHSGASGRFDYLKEMSEELVYIFKMINK